MTRPASAYRSVDWNKIFHQLKGVWWPMSRIAEAVRANESVLSCYKTAAYQPRAGRAEQLLRLYAAETGATTIPQLAGAAKPFPLYLLPRMCEGCGRAHATHG
jgi:hypothetical protein